MNERLKAQQAEIKAICQRLGISPLELAEETATQPETMRKYVNGYQPAGPQIMRSFRNFEKLRRVLTERPGAAPGPETHGPYGFMETKTLDDTLTQLALRFARAAKAERTLILANLVALATELIARETKPAGLYLQPSPAAVPNPAAQLNEPRVEAASKKIKL